MASPLGGDGSPARRAVDAAVRSGMALVDRVRPGHGDGDGPSATRVLTVGRDAEELRRLWGDPVLLGRVLAEPYTGDPSAWTVDEVSVVDGVVRFHARSGQDEPVEADGQVTFARAPQELGTEVTLALRLEGPDLAAGAAAHKALRRAKALAETGEIPTLAHNPSGRDTVGDDPTATHLSGTVDA